MARAHGVKNLVFSSSATVYGEPEFVPITESCPKHDATNPYGWTKSMLEQILSDLYTGDNEWSVVLLRYFNPIAPANPVASARIRRASRTTCCLRGPSGRGQAGAGRRLRRRLPHP